MPATINSNCFSENAEDAEYCSVIIIDSIAVTRPPQGIIYRIFVRYSSGLSQLKGANIKISYTSDGRLFEDVYYDDGIHNIPDYVVWPSFRKSPDNIEVSISLILGENRLRSAYSEPYFID